MKIAILIRRYITTGGAERYAVEVARRLAAKHDVHIFAQQFDHEPAGMTAHRVRRPFDSPAFLNRWWFSWRTASLTRGFPLVYTHEKVTRFDVANVHCGTFVGGLKGGERGERPNRLRLWLKIVGSPAIWGNWRLEQLHFKLASGRFWAADSEMVMRDVQRYYAVPDSRFFIAHSGVDKPGPGVESRRDEWRRKLGFAPDECVALFVGSEFRRKGLAALIEAMGLLGTKAPRLVVVGGQDRTPYETRAKQLGVNERIHWAGRVSNVNDYYALADVFVLPTLSDPSPLAPLEAMAHGCAAIFSGSRYTGAAELTTNGEAIVLSDPRDSAELARALARLRDPVIRSGLAEKGRALAAQLSWDRTAGVVEQALLAAAKEKGVLS